MLQHFVMPFCHIRIVLFLLDPIFITLFKRFTIMIDHTHEVWFGSNLIVLDPLKSSLFFFEVEDTVLRYNFIDLVLLSFDFIVGSSIWLECSFHILDDTVLGMQSVVSKLFPIVFFCLEALPYHFLFHSEPICLLIIHILYELLSALQILYAFICSLLFHS